MPNLPSPIERISDPLFDEHDLEVFVKRDDLIHPEIMGNKWRKLKYNLQYAREEQLEGIVTFGGAFSNHIAATAAACREHKLKCIGIIRGEELHPASNHTLQKASADGMDLQFVSRQLFRSIKADFQSLEERYPTYLILPEGGTNARAIEGCAEILDESDQSFDYVLTSVGTGGTMAGLLKSMEGQGRLIGFSALKGDFIKDEFQKLLELHNIAFSNYEIITDYHFGGYGKSNEQLISFINRIKADSGLQLDPIYTGKMYFGFRELIKRRFFHPISKILVLHTGGLQGIPRFNKQHGDVLS